MTMGYEVIFPGVADRPKKHQVRDENEGGVRLEPGIGRGQDGFQA